MNDEIELPELPLETVLMRVLPDDYYRYGDVCGYTQTQLRKYARAAVLADRARRAQQAPGEEAMRDEVAIEAMKIFLQNALDHEIDFDGYESFEEMIADQAYLMADAMRNRSIQSPGAWREIESAPKDGSRVFLWNGVQCGEGYFSKWDRDENGLVLGMEDEPQDQYIDYWEWAAGGCPADPPPTHWQPLPEPPAGDRHE